MPENTPLRSLHHWRCLVAMGVLWRDRVAYLYRWRSGMPLDEAVGGHGLLPAQYSGLGHILLSGVPESEWRVTFSHLTAAEQDRLAASLGLAARRGYARVRSTDKTAGHTLAVALGGRTRAAIGVSGVFDRAQTRACINELRAVARLITDQLDRTDDDRP